MLISFSQAAEILSNGGIVAIPTETVYGLAAALDRPDAIAGIFELKKRPPGNPLIIHLADLEDANAFVSTKPPGFDELARAFWPGPLTCILPVKESAVPAIARAALPTAGFRVPFPPEIRRLIRIVGPLVMPSANLSGKPSATSPEHIEEDFGSDFPVLEGTLPSHGLESTILSYREPEWIVLRPGAISRETLATILGYMPVFVDRSDGSTPICPGRLFRHYAPRAALYTDLEDMKKCSHILGFRERNYPLATDRRLIILGSLFRPEEVAENLYRCLRRLDSENVSDAWVDMDFPREGLWLTVAERLIRAGEKTKEG